MSSQQQQQQQQQQASMAYKIKVASVVSFYMGSALVVCLLRSYMLAEADIRLADGFCK